MTASLEGACALTHLGVIRAQGEEAERFLHSQLTQDFALLRPDQARLAAFCTAKGRMLASFVALQHEPHDVLLVTPRDVLAPTLRRLSMFVLRTKVKLLDATDAYAVHGLAGGAVGTPLQPWSLRRDGEARVVGLYPADGQPRALWIAPAGTPAPSGAPLPLERWQWGEVRSGVPWITAAVTEAFVPQMVNFESVGGVNFKKGCYPGQEVVARSQFRGTLKRRTYPAHADAPLQAGQEVFQAPDREQPTGVVVQAAPAPGGGWDALVSLQTSSAEGGVLTAGEPDGPVLTLGALPYELLADI